MPGLSLLAQERKPVVPFKTARILLPPSGTIASADVVASEEKEIPGRFELERGRAPQPTMAREAATASNGPTAFDEDKPFPTSLYELASVQVMRGYRIAILRLYPVRYVASEGRITYRESLTVTLTLSSTRLSPASNGGATQAVSSRTFRGKPRDEARVRKAVDNPEILTTYPAPGGLSVARSASRLSSSGLLDGQSVTESSQGVASCDYLVITKAPYAMKFEPLVYWKLQRGLTGKVATLEEINAAYAGRDLQEKIRNYITECYRTLGTEYVLLGGDTDIIPARGAYGEVGPYKDSEMPADIYFACLDGSWDYDGDGVYGEAGDGENGGEIDLIAEVYVGRAPVSTPWEAESFVRKTIQYEAEGSPNLSDALWVGEMLDSRTWGSDSKEELVSLLPGSFELTRLYDKDGTFSVEGVISALDASPHIVNHLGHSTEDKVLGLTTMNVDRLQNEFPFFFYTQGCDAGAFDRDDCIAEHFVMGTAGAFAVIANSRYGWYSPETTLGTSQAFDREFLKAVFDRRITNLGRALQESKEANIGDVLQTGSTRWCYFELNLLGDPETPLFTATSKGLVTFDQPQYSPRTPVVIEVADIDLNASPLVTEVAMVKLVSPRDRETVFALETTSNSGVFVAEVPLSTEAPALDGVLQVKDGDTIFATYEDADDGAGLPQTVTVTATIDDSPPRIYNVRIAEVRDTWAVIECQSNELATARLDYGLSPPFTSSVVSDEVTDTHRLVLSGLDKETVYRFRVAAIDLVGNETVDDNGGQYYSFKTMYQVAVFLDDVEEGSPSAAGQWSHQVITGGVSDWAITTDDFRSESSSWHVDDYGAPSASVLDTPAIDLKGMVTAELSFWHRMLAETDWDGGFVQVRREGTEEWFSLTQEQMMEGTPFVTLSTGNPSGPVPGWSGNVPWERVTFDLSEYAGEAIRIRFRMESDDNTDVGPGDGWYIDDIAIIRPMGTVNLDKLFYKLGDTLLITVIDAAANTNPESAEAVSVEVTSTFESIPEVVTLKETSANSSTFAGEIPTAKWRKPNDGKIGVAHNDTITVSYAGGERATATVDLGSPIITRVESTQVANSSAIIKWQTDEECRGAVRYGTSFTNTDQTAVETTRTATHQVLLSGLQPRTVYYFKVEAVDKAGNTAVADNDGKLYSFLTLGFAQGGTLTENTVWKYVEGHPYVVNGTVYVGTGTEPDPVTLTIEPGVVVQFNTNKKDVFVRGGLIARGVTFEFNLPSGDFAHIFFEEEAAGIIENSVISVRGPSYQLSGGIECYSSHVRFTNNIVRNAYYGFHCLSCSPRISGNTFVVCHYAVFLHAAAERYSSPEITDNTFMECMYPISCEGAAYPVISGNSFDGNGYDGLIRTSIEGDTIWPGYDCTQFVIGDLSVPQESTLWIAPGATVQLAQPGTDFYVSGTLHAEGATIEFGVPAEPRTFLAFSPTSTGSIRNCRLVGKAWDGSPTGGVKCQSSALSFTGNVFSNLYYAIFCGYSTEPLIANNTIVGCEYGIYASDATPKIANCILWNNGDDLVGCAGAYLNTEDGDPGEGNISLDPLFRDSENGDFRLSPGSPCIDSGTSEMAPLIDASGYLRWDDPDTLDRGGGPRSYFDIGAYEYVVDADRDLICDDWEVAYGLNPKDRTDASADADGDGKSNREEYLAGTNPFEAGSCLRVITFVGVGDESGGTVTTWLSRGGRKYTVFYADELCPPLGRRFGSAAQEGEPVPDLTVWKPCSEAMEGTGSFLSFTDRGDSTRKGPFDPSVPRRFYRVEMR
jgi:parallel beta-helix repeat protein